MDGYTMTEEVATAAGERCFHCGEGVTPSARRSIVVAGVEQAFCCGGCAAAAAAIVDFGLADYYRQREEFAPRPPAAADAARLAIYDDPLLLARFATADGTAREATLSVTGMGCSACAWLLESRLACLPGVERFEVHYATRRARLRWRPTVVSLATVLGAVESLGYGARPFTPDARREELQAEAATLLRELGVALIFGMQVMMIAFAFYVQDSATMDATMRGFLRWTSLVLTLPVLVYSSRPFFRGALYTLRAGTASMDVPVAAALALAFAGSAWHTLTGQGEVYYDSVVMFTTLLCASRYLELRGRVAAGSELDAFAALVPDSACRVVVEGTDERLETVPVVRLAAGDHVLVRPGETVPADGVVLHGESALDESVLTGESTPQVRGAGAAVLAGSINGDSPLTLRVTAVAGASFAGYLADLVQRAAAARPPLVALSQRLAARFVGVVLLVGVLTALYWLDRDATRWMEATLSVLVVACPCALAIAVPAALAAASAGLLARQVAVLGPHALERLATATHYVFDKTGTLTTGRLALVGVAPQPGVDEASVLAVAAALAQGSDHPIARTLRALPAASTVAPARAVRGVTGRGLIGEVAGRTAVLGAAGLVAEHLQVEFPPAVNDAATEAWVAQGDRLLGRLAFADDLRGGGTALFAALHAQGARCLVLSGDRAAAVARVARACGADEAVGELTPADKLARVAALQAGGARVVMTGDGINDAPVLARADVSIAVADSSGAARQQADILLLGEDLDGIAVAAECARFTRHVMRQNLGWAAAYNLAGLPLAAAGLVPPWLAALGMSLSSLAVVLNALRIRARLRRG